MVLVPATQTTVGTTVQQREHLAEAFRCDVSWLNGDFNRKSVKLPAYWIDIHPVTNAQYAAYCAATGARQPWLKSAFPPARADHPVVNVSLADAQAYAAWAGRRIPTGEEWEVAARGIAGKRYSWGQMWPGPVQFDDLTSPWAFNLPLTHPVGSLAWARAPGGMCDVAGQVCEWTTSQAQDREKPRSLLKGSSWLHRQPEDFRTSGGCFVPGAFSSPLIGFRCAMDADQTPSPLPAAPPDVRPEPSDSVATSRDVNREAGPHIVRLPEAPESLRLTLTPWHRSFVNEDRQMSRGFLIHGFDGSPWSASLFVCESLRWNREQLLAGYSKPVPFRPAGTEPSGRPKYAMAFPPIDVSIEFHAGADFIDQVISVTNNTGEPGTFLSSSCAAMTSHPGFYDPEGERTCIYTRGDGFVPSRRQRRLALGSRWITDLDLSPHGDLPANALMGVVSRDGRWTFGSARAGEGAACEARSNAWLTCLHTTAPIEVGPHRTASFVTRLYFLPGGLESLARRFKEDLARHRLELEPAASQSGPVAR